MYNKFTQSQNINLKTYFSVYLTSLLTFLLMDAIWLGVVAREDYQTSIGFLMREDVPIWPWVSFYLLYVAVIVKLCIFCGSQPRILRTIAHAICLGAAAYGAYNLTNYAIIDGWPLSNTLKDWVWGMSITTSSAIAGFVCYFWLTKKSDKANTTSELNM